MGEIVPQDGLRSVIVSSSRDSPRPEELVRQSQRLNATQSGVGGIQRRFV